MKKALILLGTALAISPVYAAKTSGTISFTNDYRFNGISQTAGDPAVQGSLDVAFDNGIYAGMWGSNLDFGSDIKTNLETDFYVGYSAAINDDVSYDANIAYYTYNGYKAVDGNYGQLNLSLFYKNLSLKYGYTNNYFNTSTDAHYAAVEYSYPFDHFSIDFHAGRSFGEYWGKKDISDYSDYSIGVSTSQFGLDLSAAYVIVDTKKTDEDNSGAFRNDDTLVFTVSRTF